jgi:hypothetical protein
LTENCSKVNSLANYNVRLCALLKDPKIMDYALLHVKSRAAGSDAEKVFKIRLHDNKTLYENDVELDSYSSNRNYRDDEESNFIGFKGQITENGLPVKAHLSVELLRQVDEDETAPLTLL